MKAGFGLFTGKQAKPMQEYFSIYFIKEKQLFQTNGKDALQFYRQREKKKKLEAYSSPEWYEVTKQLRHECSK